MAFPDDLVKVTVTHTLADAKSVPATGTVTATPTGRQWTNSGSVVQAEISAAISNGQWTLDLPAVDQFDNLEAYRIVEEDVPGRPRAYYIAPTLEHAPGPVDVSTVMTVKPTGGDIVFTAGPATDSSMTETLETDGTAFRASILSTIDAGVGAAVPGAVAGVIAEDPTVVDAAATRAVSVAADAAIAGAVADTNSNTARSVTATIVRTTEQTDYVAMAERFSPYTALEIKKTPNPFGGSDPTIEVSCVAEGGRHVTYHVVNRSGGPGSYRIVSRIWEGDTDMAYYPPAGESHSTDHGAYDFTPSQGVRSGTFLGTNTHYTTQVGAYIESPAPVPIRGGSLRVSWYGYTEDRGGIWRLSIADHPEFGHQDFSVWNATASIVNQPNVWAVEDVPDGEYIVRATFHGDDPAHVPSSGVGTSRGYLNIQTAANYLLRVSDLIPSRNQDNSIKAAYSNPDFAVSFRPVEGGEYRYFPHHEQGEQTETPISTRFYDGVTELDLDALAIGERLPLTTSFEWVQHFRARNTTTGPDLIEIRSRQGITRAGVHHVNVSLKALAAFDVRTVGAMMLVVNPSIFDTAVSALGNAYSIDTADHADGTTTYPVEKNRAGSWAVASTAEPDLIAAVRYNNLERTFHLTEEGPADPFWIDHRTSFLTKFYTRMNYQSGTIIPAGTVWNLSGDFYHGRIPGIGGIVAP